MVQGIATVLLGGHECEKMKYHVNCSHFLFNIQAPLIMHYRFLIDLHIPEHLCGFSERKDNPVFLSSGDQSLRLTSESFVFALLLSPAIIIVLCNSGDTHLTRACLVILCMGIGETN